MNARTLQEIIKYRGPTPSAKVIKNLKGKPVSLKNKYGFISVPRRYGTIFAIPGITSRGYDKNSQIAIYSSGSVYHGINVQHKLSDNIFQQSSNSVVRREKTEISTLQSS